MVRLSCIRHVSVSYDGSLGSAVLAMPDVSFVDGRGLSPTARDEVWARAAASAPPARTVVLTDDVDFTGLRALGLSFEYLPPYRGVTPWWSDEADHARWEDERLAAMRLGYGLDDLD